MKFVIGVLDLDIIVMVIWGDLDKIVMFKIYSVVDELDIVNEVCKY